MKKLFFIIVLIIFCNLEVFSQGTTCATSQPFCTGNISFPARTNGPAAEANNYYGCLGTQPNPSWFFFRAGSSGSLTFVISGANTSDDIDFICWGPFSSLTGVCGSQLTQANTLACSYSSSFTETVNLSSVVANQFYMVLITNYGNSATQITFTQTGGTGSLNCNAISANPTSCSSPSNMYSVSGSVLANTPPASGTLTISDNSGVSQVFHAPFSLPLSYTLSGITSNGAVHTVTAVFSANPALNSNTTYTAPAPCGCATVTFTGLPTVACPNSTALIPLTGSPTPGTFSGPGIVGTNNFNPSLAGTGTQTITYTYTGCPPVSKTIYIPDKPYKINNVLSSSATTYSDNWLLDFSNSSLNAAGTVLMDSYNPFDASSKGIWRGQESYTYVTERKQTVDGSLKPAVKLQTDGTFDNMPLYDWSDGLMGSCNTEWRKINTITKYNLNNYEIENKDILNIYSAALYGYNGNLATAVAGNAGTGEIAYESFEEYTPGQSISPSNVTTGNFTIYTQVPAAGDYKVTYKEVEIESARANSATLLLPLDNSLLNKKVKIMGANYSSIENGTEISAYNNKNIYGYYTVKSVAADPEGDPNKSVIGFDNTDFLFTGAWNGKIAVPYTVTSGNLPRVVTGNGISIVNTFALTGKQNAHTGKQCLSVLGNIEMEQERFSPRAGKYILSAWVSISNPNVYTFQSPSAQTSKRGIQVEFISKTGVSTFSSLFEPSGAVIENWQKIENEFDVPVNTARIVIKIFAPHSTSSDYLLIDDIRISPSLGKMKTYVYNKTNLKLGAILDDNNFATLFYYDQQGNLYLTKKETERGIFTIQESFSHQQE